MLSGQVTLISQYLILIVISAILTSALGVQSSSQSTEETPRYPPGSQSCCPCWAGMWVCVPTAQPLWSCIPVAVLHAIHRPHMAKQKMVFCWDLKRANNHPCLHPIENIFFLSWLWIWIKTWRGWLKWNSLWRGVNTLYHCYLFLPFILRGQVPVNPLWEPLLMRQGAPTEFQE